MHMLRRLRCWPRSTTAARSTMRCVFGKVARRARYSHWCLGHWSLCRLFSFQCFSRREEVDRRLLQLEQHIPILWFQQAAISALLIAAALARSFLAFLRLVRTFRNGRNTLAPTSSAIAARARIGRPTRAFHCPEDFLPTYRNATGCCTVAANT